MNRELIEFLAIMKESTKMNKIELCLNELGKLVNPNLKLGSTWTESLHMGKDIHVYYTTMIESCHITSDFGLSEMTHSRIELGKKWSCRIGIITPNIHIDFYYEFKGLEQDNEEIYDSYFIREEKGNNLNLHSSRDSNSSEIINELHKVEKIILKIQDYNSIPNEIEANINQIIKILFVDGLWAFSAHLFQINNNNEIRIIMDRDSISKTFSFVLDSENSKTTFCYKDSGMKYIAASSHEIEDLYECSFFQNKNENIKRMESDRDNNPNTYYICLELQRIMNILLKHKLENANKYFYICNTPLIL